MDRLTAITLVDTVRRALPGCDAVTGLRAVRGLALLRNGEPDATFRRAYLAQGRPGEADAYTSTGAPDPWVARAHEETSKRSNSGRTLREVRRYGMATVQGDTDDGIYGISNDLGAVLPNVLAARLRKVTRKRCGWDALDVTAITDDVFGPLGLPALLGTDVRSYEQIVRPADGVDPMACRVAHRNTQLQGWAHDADVADLTPYDGIYGTHTSVRTVWPTRRKLPAVVVRKSEREHVAPITDTRSATIGYESSDVVTTTIKGVTYRANRWTVADDVSTVRPFTVIALPSAADDPTMFVGHRKITRGPLASTVRRGKRAARTIGTVDAPATVAGWQELCENLNRGEAVATVDGVRISRNPKGRYNITDKRTGHATYYNGVRTSQAVALKLTV